VDANMSLGPVGIAASTAGTPLAQTKGSALERAQEQVGAERRQVYHEKKAAAAAGVGEPDGEDHETTDRDADGRRPWEEPPEAPAAAAGDSRPSKDPSQQSGNLLDLTG
jgi:hypothetical protein